MASLTWMPLLAASQIDTVCRKPIGVVHRAWSDCAALGYCASARNPFGLEELTQTVGVLPSDTDTPLFIKPTSEVERRI